MAAENGTWGAPRIHGELLKLSVAVSERTVSRYLQDQPRHRTSRPSWLAFLRNHREAIAAMDLFTVPTVAGRLLYVFFVIRHARRQVPRADVTEHPTASWISQQLREAFPDGATLRQVHASQPRPTTGRRACVRNMTHLKDERTRRTEPPLPR
jgi:hypothetical protein